MWGGGLKFVFKVELIIPEIWGHVLAEGSQLSVPAPRRVQIFFQVWKKVSILKLRKKYVLSMGVKEKGSVSILIFLCVFNRLKLKQIEILHLG